MEAHNLIWNWFEFVMIWFVIICDLNKSQVSVMAMLAGIVRYQINTRMWANAQRDGRPAKHRWRPLFNAAVWLTPTTRVPCSSAAKTRNPLKLTGGLKFANRSQPLVGRSSPYCEAYGETLLIAWRARGKIITSVLCSIVCNNCTQWTAHTYEQT